MTLSELLVNYRNEHSLSQRQFAIQCGVSNGYIAMLEKKVNPKTGLPMTPSLPSLKKIASTMGITLSDLFSLVDDMPVDISYPDSWSEKFRQSLSNRLPLLDKVDCADANINLHELNTIASSSGQLSLETCCNACDELGESLDEMTGLREKSPTAVSCEADSISMKIAEIITRLPADKRAEALNYISYLEAQSKNQ